MKSAPPPPLVRMPPRPPLDREILITRLLQVLWWLCLLWFLSGAALMIYLVESGALWDRGRETYDREKVELLIHAIQSGNEEKVGEILDDNPKLANAEQDWVNKWTMLHDAAASGRLAITEQLLARGAKVNVSNAEGETPLHWAVRNGHTEIARMLLEHRADPNTREVRKHRTPLHEAAFRGRGEIARMLLERGADPNAVDAAGKTPLFYAQDDKHEDIVSLLRLYGARE